MSIWMLWALLGFGPAKVTAVLGILAVHGDESKWDDLEDGSTFLGWIVPGLAIAANSVLANRAQISGLPVARLHVVGDGETTYSYDLDANNQLDTEWSGNTTITYTYDNRGNPTKKETNDNGSKTTDTYTYDDNNKLTKIAYDGGTSNEYEYNGDGRRVKSESTAGTVTYFLYDGSNVMMELDSDGDAAAFYTHGPEGLVSMRLSSTNYYVGCDHLGTAWNVVTLDNDDTISATYTYTAFGTPTTVGEDSTGNPYKYVGTLGYYHDSESSLMLLGARYYNPRPGRFLTIDPIKDGMNWYAYAANNPMRFVDPTGLHSDEECLDLCFFMYGADAWTCRNKFDRCKLKCLYTGLGYWACVYAVCQPKLTKCLWTTYANFVDCQNWCQDHRYGCKPHHDPPRRKL